MKKILGLLVLGSVLIGCATPGRSHIESHQLAEPVLVQKVMVVMDSPAVVDRARLEQSFVKLAQRYTPQSEVAASITLMPNLATLTNATGLNSVATLNQVNGILILTLRTSGNVERSVCPLSTISTAPGATTKACQMVSVPYARYKAQLYSATPYQEIWQSQIALEGTVGANDTQDNLFRDMAIKVLKGLQREKFLAPAQHQ